MKLYRIILLFLVVQSCMQTSGSRKKELLWQMVKSNNIDSIIDATIEIQKAKDTSMIDAILYNSDDPRITNRLEYKGFSVYQIKMQSLRMITGIKPPKQVTYNVDTSIINFYKNTLRR